MSELSIEPEMPEEKLKEMPVERKLQGRLEWVDMARGFIMLYLIFTISFPGDSNVGIGSIPIIGGLFQHAAAGTGRLTVFDLGAPIFIFILGLTMPISYRKRKEKKGTNSAIKYILFRYLILFVLGFVIANFKLDFINYYSIPRGELLPLQGVVPLLDRPVMFIINWGVIINIAVSGLVGFLFMAVRNPKYRFFLGYGWILLYQVGLGTTEVLQIYGTVSIQSGIFGSIFGYGSIAIIATAMGDYIFFSDVVAIKKFRALLIFGIINYIVPFIFYLGIDHVELQFFIQGFPISAYMANFSFALTSIGVACIVLWVFYTINTRFKKNAPWLRMFGMSSLLIYFIAVVPDMFFENIFIMVTNLELAEISWWLSLAWGVIILACCSVVAWIMFKNNKKITTVKSSLIFLVTIIGILLILIVLELTVGIGFLSVFN